MEYEELDNGTGYAVRDYEEYEEYEEYEDRYGPATRTGDDLWNRQVLHFLCLMFLSLTT